MNVLGIGDKIKWVDSMHDITYNVSDIIVSGEGGEIKLEWVVDGVSCSMWGSTLEEINYKINKGLIIIVKRNMDPNKDIKKFTL